MKELPYPPSRYDEKFHLRVSAHIWLVILWSVHPVIALVLGAFSKSGEIFGVIVGYVYNAPSLIACAPGALVLFAALNRSPAAGKRVRGIWRHGRLLLAIGLALLFASVLYTQGGKVADLEEEPVASLAISAALFVTLLASRYSRDLFRDFPEPDPPQGQAR